jgi:pullulanase/glycogen debranching enzyme
MYETFGFSRWPDNQLGFQLFVPDNTIDPNQYTGGDSPRITSVAVVGDFQQAANPSAQNWDISTALKMTQQQHPNGLLFTAPLPPNFPDGYYQYKYIVTFQNGEVRWVGDPCTKYGGNNSDNSAFVVGGSSISAKPLNPAKRLSGADLAIYEVMIDDFTAGYRANRAPVDAMVDKIPYIKNLGINAIEFMPWVAWPDSDDFSWGYDPAFYFSVEYAYITDPSAPLEKLSRLAAMISACHDAGLMVILDVVLQHASAGVGTRGFPYYWLWQDPGQCPFIGSFTTAPTYGSLPLNYYNACTLQFISDVCKYWVQEFAVDGFRFDQVSGYDNPQFPTDGAPALMTNLKTWLTTQNNNTFPLIIEDTWDFTAVQDTNNIGATHGWFDMFRSYPAGYLGYGNQPQPPYLRVLNAAQDFNFPIGPVTYLENHDHSTATFEAGGRNLWYRVQPYMIALATCSGAVMLANGQEFGRSQYLPESDDGLPKSQQRVNPRPLDWTEATDPTGQSIQSIYKSLLQLRQQNPGLRSPNFYPDNYNWQSYHFSPDGYGLDIDKQIVIYHRWGTSAVGQLERFIIVLNFSATQQTTNIPFPVSGVWVDLLNGNTPVQVANYWLYNYPVNSYWGCIFKLQA